MPSRPGHAPASDDPRPGGPLRLLAALLAALLGLAAALGVGLNVRAGQRADPTDALKPRGDAPPAPIPAATPLPPVDSSTVWQDAALGLEVRPCGGPASSSRRPAILLGAVDLHGPPDIMSAYVRTSLVSGGQLDLSNGRLRFLGGEEVLHPDPSRTLALPAGKHPLTLLMGAHDGGAEDLLALEVRTAPRAPVRWVDEAVAGTDAGVVAVISERAVARLSRGGADGVQLPIPDLGGRTPCERYSFTGDEDAAGSAAAVVLRIGGDGGGPGAVGYDAAGSPVAFVVSLGVVPWSRLGLPGTPPDGEPTEQEWLADAKAWLPGD